MREMGARRCPPGGKKVCSRAASAIGAGGPAVSLLHSEGEAALRVRSHISPGPYRSFRELSLAGSVDPVIWCPPTFVGNSGIERFNGLCGFALLFLLITLLLLILSRAAIWIPTALQLSLRPSSRAMFGGTERCMTASASKADLRAAALAKRDALSD